MNTERLTTLIDEAGLSEDRDKILAAALPAILLRLGQAEQGHVGLSRAGGTPDLPPSLAWPRSSAGYNLCFMLQINLAELPAFPDNPLPEQGMLYLFLDEADYHAKQLPVYTGNEELKPAQPPNGEQCPLEWSHDMVPHRLTFELIADVPRWASMEYTALHQSFAPGNEHQPKDGDAWLDDIGHALSSGSVGKLLGHVSGIGHDPREHDYMTRAIQVQERHTSAAADIAPDTLPALSWINLLELESSRQLNVMFGDAGYVQVLIPAEDLQQHEFGRLFVNTQSS